MKLIKKLIIVLLFFSIISILDASSTDLKQLISNKIWKWYDSGLNSGLYYEFKFNKNNQLELINNFSGEPISYFGGDYIIKDDEIIINYAIISSHMIQDEIKEFEKQKKTNSIPKRKIICRVVNLENSYYYEKCIKCNNNAHIVNDDLTYRPNTNLKYKDIDVITINKKACAKDNVKLREDPDVKSKSYQYIEGYFEKRYDFLPKGICFNVLIKTKEKYNVNKWNNYWYLIDLQSAYQEKNISWVFGEFVKFK
jgi:hypothetical protein